MAVNIKGTFKKDEKPNNGLEAVAGLFHMAPHVRRIVVGIVRPVTGKIDYADGTISPTVNFENLEVPVDEEDAKKLWEVLAAAYERRTGNPMPPQSLFDGPGSPAADDTLEGEDPIPGLGGDDADGAGES